MKFYRPFCWDDLGANERPVWHKWSLRTRINGWQMCGSSATSELFGMSLSAKKTSVQSASPTGFSAFYQIDSSLRKRKSGLEPHHQHQSAQDGKPANERNGWSEYLVDPPAILCDCSLVASTAIARSCDKRTTATCCASFKNVWW